MAHGQVNGRREFLQSSAALLGLAGAGAMAEGRFAEHQLEPVPVASGKGWPGFPQQDPALAKEIVGASHGNIARVKELLAAHPALAKASYDWGYGDWETALGAASHVGNREIAALLLASGARLDIFAATMLGMSEVVLAILKVQPALARTRGPHGISLVAHAAAGKNAELFAALKAIEGADEPDTTPLTPAEIMVYQGTYVQESGEQILINQNKFGMTIKGGAAGIDRLLVRTGENSFHPVGAPNVRIVFSVKDSNATAIEIVEDAWHVSALRRM